MIDGDLERDNSRAWLERDQDCETAGMTLGAAGLVDPCMGGDLDSDRPRNSSGEGMGSRLGGASGRRISDATEFDRCRRRASKDVSLHAHAGSSALSA